MEQPLRLTYYDIVLVGAILGLLIGLIPLIVGIVRKKVTLGVGGLAASAIGGAILGIFLSIPLASAFVWLILKKPAVAEPTADDSRIDPDASENGEMSGLELKKSLKTDIS